MIFFCFCFALMAGKVLTSALVFCFNAEESVGSRIIYLICFALTEKYNSRKSLVIGIKIIQIDWPQLFHHISHCCHYFCLFFCSSTSGGFCLGLLLILSCFEEALQWARRWLTTAAVFSRRAVLLFGPACQNNFLLKYTQ